MAYVRLKTCLAGKYSAGENGISICQRHSGLLVLNSNDHAASKHCALVWNQNSGRRGRTLSSSNGTKPETPGAVQNLCRPSWLGLYHSQTLIGQLWLVHKRDRIRSHCTVQPLASLSEDGSPQPSEQDALEEKNGPKTETGRGLGDRVPRPRWLLGVVLVASVVTAVAVGALFGGNPAAAVSESAGSTPGGLASMTAEAVAEPAFTFNFFGLKGRLGEQTPGWIYFLLLMAAGFGLFVSEEALNMWVGASLGRALVWDGQLDTLAAAIAANAPAVMSTIVWVYWGVCISDMIPFFAGRWASQRGQAVKDKVLNSRKQLLQVTETIQKYGNLIGFVERFSVGVRNPTSFLAGAAGVAPEKYFAGVCLGGLITLPIQLGLGLACRDNPLTALAVVATVVGTWSLVPFALAAFASLSLFLERRSPGETMDEEPTVA